jgi:hypothetical protein
MVLDPGIPAAPLEGLSGSIEVRIVGADDPILPAPWPFLTSPSPSLEPTLVSRENRNWRKRSTLASPTDRSIARSCASGRV